MPTRTDINAQIHTEVLLAPTAVSDATPEAATPIWLPTFDQGSRYMLLLGALETVETNTGGTWTVLDSESSGGSTAAADIHGTLEATPAAAGYDVQQVSVIPNPARPWLRVVYTGADASTDVEVSVTLLVVPRTL